MGLIQQYLKLQNIPGGFSTFSLETRLAEPQGRDDATKELLSTCVDSICQSFRSVCGSERHNLRLSLEMQIYPKKHWVVCLLTAGV